MDLTIVRLFDILKCHMASYPWQKQDIIPSNYQQRKISKTLEVKECKAAGPQERVRLAMSSTHSG